MFLIGVVLQYDQMKLKNRCSVDSQLDVDSVSFETDEIT